MAETQKITKALSRANRGGGGVEEGRRCALGRRCFEPPREQGWEGGAGLEPGLGVQGLEGGGGGGGEVVVVEVSEVQLSAPGAAARAGRKAVPAPNPTPARSPLHSTFKTLTFTTESEIVQLSRKFQIG